MVGIILISQIRRMLERQDENAFRMLMPACKFDVKDQ